MKVNEDIKNIKLSPLIKNGKRIIPKIQAEIIAKNQFFPDLSSSFVCLAINLPIGYPKKEVIISKVICNGFIL